MTTPRQRLVGMELHAERPGDGAAFYSWLLGPGSSDADRDWSPIGLLFSHGVCGVHRTAPGGPPAGWNPVFAVDDVREAARRMEAYGGRLVFHEHRAYLVDADGVWTRVVPLDRMPPDLDPDAVGRTDADYLTADSGATAARYADVLGLEALHVLDDADDFHVLLDGGRLALGTVSYSPERRRAIGAPRWLIYFEVPEIAPTVRRSVEVGCLTVVAEHAEDYTEWAILLDPFDTPFGLSRYYDLARSTVLVETPEGPRPLGERVRLD